MDFRYFISRITVVKKDGTRKCFPVKGNTNNLDVRRNMLKKVHQAERIYFTYEQKMN